MTSIDQTADRTAAPVESRAPRIGVNSDAALVPRTVAGSPARRTGVSWLGVLATGAFASLLGCGGGGGGGSSNGSPTPSLSVSTTSLPDGQVGTPYSATLAASGGTPSYQWTLTSGALPAGLALTASTGQISGNPTAAVSSDPITVQVTDSSTPARSNTRSLSLTVAPAALAITTTSLPQGAVDVAYSTTLAAKGGTAPYSWSITSGTLPTGLSLASATGVISGTPGAATSASITFEVKDSSTPTATQSSTLAIAITVAPLNVTTTALANGQIGKPYASMLTASGGTPPLSWSLTSGTLPAGISLNSSTGAIAGTPSATANATPLTFTVSDSGSPTQSKLVSLTLNVSPATISVVISPQAAGLTVTQTTPFSATTNDNAGVRWSISPSGGSFSPAVSLTGANVTLTAPGSAGVYTVTATSITDATQSSSAQVGVTKLAGVFTYHNDIARDGVNNQEYALTPANVNASGFGKLFSCAVDGAIYGQPLWAANLTVNGARHNVVFVATQHDSLYAFDADANPCVQLWSVSLIDSNHGGTPGETSVPSGTTGQLVGKGDGDITPETGVTGTAVIDPSGILYVVSKSVNGAGNTFYQRLHAIDVTTGKEKSASPVLIQGTFPGTGDGGTTDAFNPGTQNQRPGLALANGTVYIAWASHEDQAPYYGWVIGYRYGTSGFSQTAVLNVTPNVRYGGIWMGGSAPSVDPNGNLYVITGNGHFDATSPSAPNNDYGDSFLELSVTANPPNVNAGLSIYQYFTPTDQQSDEDNDLDFGAGGAAVLADVVAGNPATTTHLVVGGGKDGYLYVLNRDSMGNLGDGNAWEIIHVGYPIYSTAAFWNNTLYLAPVAGPLASYILNTANTPIEFTLQSMASSPGSFGYPGSTPSVSASGGTNGLLWVLDNSRFCTPESGSCGPAVLHAYDATDLAELWNSSLAPGGADNAGNAVKFVVPTIANGKVYVGTRGNNSGGTYGSSSVSGELDVYGLKPN